ncbi:hypothetical protein ACS8FD_22445, partial [Psychrobacter sp. 1U2]
TAQTDFEEANPEAEALDHRSRDAESTLSERMSYNHSRGINTQLDTDDGHLNDHNGHESSEGENVSTQGSKWQDGLRREEDDKA